MKSNWLNNVLPIAAIFSFRMLGLFMLIPVFSVWATQLESATPTLIGIALGSYGLSQGLLQMPMGMLSDRFGRKPILTIGLLLFTVGSLWGALTHSIYGMIGARIIQGTGAVGSVLIALLADLTPDEQRTKSMAIIGATIGLSFSLAMVISPSITQSYGLSGIFYFSTMLGIFGLIILHKVIPTPNKESFHFDSEPAPALLSSVLKNIHLQRLNFGIFAQHLILTSTFFAIPMILQQQMQASHLSQSWQFYLPIMLLSFICMIPFIAIAERKRKIKMLFVSAVLLIVCSQGLLLYTYGSWLSMCLLLFVYFVAFNFLEAMLPSLVSRQAGAQAKGTAMGVYSTSQFIGLFVGGACSGLLYHYASFEGIFLFNAIVALAWLAFSVFMKPYVYQTTLLIPLKPTQSLPDANLKNLKLLPGVLQVVVAKAEHTLYLKVDMEKYVPGSAEKLIPNTNSAL